MLRCARKMWTSGRLLACPLTVIAGWGRAVEIAGIDIGLERPGQHHTRLGPADGDVADTGRRDLVLSRRLCLAGLPGTALVIHLRRLRVSGVMAMTGVKTTEAVQVQRTCTR